MEPRTQRPTPLRASAIDLELANPAFSGPLALLLELIESRRLPITALSLTEVTQQYLERMRSMVGIDPEILTDFLVIAARLLLIKSRELLPSSKVKTEEPDVAEDLQLRLLEYRVFREAAESLRVLEENGRRSFARQPSSEPFPRPEPPLDPIDPERLQAAMLRMLKALKPQTQPLSLAPRVTVQERIEHLLGFLSRAGSAIFSDLGGNSIQEIVATFLALLELLRRGMLLAYQEEPFGEIRLSLAPTT